MTREQLAEERTASLERQRRRDAMAIATARHQLALDRESRPKKRRPQWDAFKRIPRGQRPS